MMNKHLILTLVTVAAITFSISSAFASGAPHSDFPDPRAEAEFAALLPDLTDFSDHFTQDNVKGFIDSASEYGPLDLQVRHAKSPEEACLLRTLHLAAAASASHMSAEVVARLGQPFRTSPGEIAKRRLRLAKKIPEIQRFVYDFIALPKITLLASWGDNGDYRVNDVFHINNRTSEAIPSSLMGFVPSGTWTNYKSMQQYLDTLQVSKKTFNNLHAEFMPLRIGSAIRLTDGSIQIIDLSVGGNETGLLIAATPSARPRVGQKQYDGRQFVHVEQLLPKLYYFETANERLLGN